MSSHADTIRALLPSRGHDGTWFAANESEQAHAELDALLAENQRLREIVENFTEHGSWRCQYRTRYKRCVCGLDELLAALGLPPCGFDDPEALAAAVEE